MGTAEHTHAAAAPASFLAADGRRRAAIASVAMAVPERLVGNDTLARILGVPEHWIAKRTGTNVRPWAQPGERLDDFAARAGREALARACVHPEAVELVLVATSSADEITPNAAPVVAGAVGAHGAAALDVGAACTGWLAALAIACGQIESGRASNVLVIGADFLSRFLDPSDRDTLPLFADGAGAAVVSLAADGEGGIGPIALHSDSTGAELIRLERSGTIRLQGPETFRAAVRSLTEVTLEACALAGCALEDVSLFVYHQANSRILRAVGERLELPSERVVDCMARYANTSTATLPIALSVAEREGRLQAGENVLLAAFGGGFTWGGTVVRWPGGGA
jgi:3-oxoacyl-[acyl-carrier-protein] synthase-3